MPAPTRDLERTLQRALSVAGGRGQAGLAHLALALADDVDVKGLLRACAVDVAALTASLCRLVDDEAQRGVAQQTPAQLAPAVDRTIQRAAAHAQACGRDHFGGPQVLIALLAEPDEAAADALRNAGLTRFDAARYVSHGLKKGQVARAASLTPACNSGEAVRVLLLNDDFTPMEFVVDVLRNVFGKDEDEAVRVMLEIHRRGFAECGAYPRETAAATVAAVAKLARDHQHPLACVMEPLRGPSDALLFTQPRTVIASGPGDRQRA